MSTNSNLPEIGELASYDNVNVVVRAVVSKSVVVVENCETGEKFRCDPNDLERVRAAPASARREATAGNTSAPEVDKAPTAAACIEEARAAYEAARDECADADPSGPADDPASPAGALRSDPVDDTEVVEGTAPLRGGLVISTHPDEIADIEAIGEHRWSVAKSRFAIIEPLLEIDQRTREDVDRAAENAGVGASSVYRWLKLYTQTRRISSLAPDAGGLRAGQTRLDEAREAIITSAIVDLYLTRNRRDATDVYETIKIRCRNEGLAPPSRSTFDRRLRNIPKPEKLKKRGQGDLAFALYGPTHRERDPAEMATPPSAPLEEVQMDHTRADVILVEETTGEPIGRPWVTLAIDVATRMPASIFVSMTPPCAASNGLCIARAMLPKGDWLKSLGVEGMWPVHGKIGRLRLDNGKDFRATGFIRACNEAGIDVVFRPPKCPADGAYIERLMGTLARQCARLPGKTASNVRDRQGLAPQASASMTLREFEAYLLDFFVNQYPKQHHQGLNTAPLVAFNEAMFRFGDTAGTGPRSPVPDPEHLKTSFMPWEKRTLQRYGVHVNGLRYWSDTLEPLVKRTSQESAKTLKKFTVRYDPFDLSYVLVYDDEANIHHFVPLARGEVSAFSVWDLKAVRKVQKREGQKLASEPAFFETLIRLRGQIETARSRGQKRSAAKHRENQRISERIRRERDIRAVVAANDTAPDSTWRFARPASPITPALPARPDAFDDFGED